MKMSPTIAAMCAPLVLMSLWIGQQYYIRATAPSVLLAVEGGDPRDLLSGHYMRYRVQYGDAVDCTSSTYYKNRPDQCACLKADPETGVSTATWFGDCDSKPETCESSIRGVCRYGRTFIANIERYYFPESCKGPLRFAPPNSRIEVKVPAKGNAMVSNFYVGDQTAIEYCQSSL
jgi:uncharacterized membrane-anchored protein